VNPGGHFEPIYLKSVMAAVQIAASALLIPPSGSIRGSR
jgi:hypothetical protein